MIVKLDEMMRRKGIKTQLELAEMIEVSKNTLTTLKLKGTGNLTTISNLCKVLECQPGDLLEYVPEEKK